MKNNDILISIGLAMLGAWLAPKFVKKLDDMRIILSNAWDKANDLQKCLLILLAVLNFYPITFMIFYDYAKYISEKKK